MTEISVIIPCYNAKATIEKCLESVLSQSFDDTVEYLVVDSSDDGTYELIKERYPEVKVIRSNKRIHCGAARNIAIQATQSRYLLFIDTDCIAPPEWIEKLMYRLKEEDRPVVGGSIINGYPRSLVAETEYFLEFGEFVPERPKGNVPFIPTAYIGYQREVFEHHGLFMNDDLCGADRLFHAELLFDGISFFFDPEIQVIHLHRTDSMVMLKHQWDLGYSSGFVRTRVPISGQLLKRYPWLWPLMSLARLVRIYRRMSGYKAGYAGRVAKTLPLMFVTLLVWAHGFQKGINPNNTSLEKEACQTNEQ